MRWLDNAGNEECQSVVGRVGILALGERVSVVSRAPSECALLNTKEHWGWDAIGVRPVQVSDRPRIEKHREKAPDYSEQTCDALRRGAALIRGKEPQKAMLFLQGLRILQRRSDWSHKSTKIASTFLILAFIVSALSPLAAASMNSQDLVGDVGGTSGSGNSLGGALSNFTLGVRSANLTTTTTSSSVKVWTQQYLLNVDYSTHFVNYTIHPYFTSDFIWYRREQGEFGPGTCDEKGTNLDGVHMTISAWGRNGNVVWFIESCPEFSLNQSFDIYRDYFELNVHYSPGTKNVLTTYFIALANKMGTFYNMDSGGNYAYSYIPGCGEDTPTVCAMGGWYPCYTFAPCCDMRTHGGVGNLGVEWGYNETVAYLQTPQWMPTHNPSEGGSSVFGLEFGSTNSLVPNIGLGKGQTFHMFVRPYQFNDGKTHGYDVGYAQWVAPRIASYWGNHNTPVFPLTEMLLSSWDSTLKTWVENSQIKVATYSSNGNQINWNYKSASLDNLPAGINPPVAWEIWDASHTWNGECNPVSGPYMTPGTFRWHLIQNDTDESWWTSTAGVFWDMMDSWDSYTAPRQDYQNKSEFVYNGYLRLVQDSFSSGYWSYVITNSYYGSLHLAIASSLTCIEGYEPSSTYGAGEKEKVRSIMDFVNNIPSQYRPKILVYQYYSTSNWKDQNDVYSALFGSARYKFDVTLYSYNSGASQIHNLQMAEDMFKAMGCSRDVDNRINVGTLDLNQEGSSLTTGASMVVTQGKGSPSITFTAAFNQYNLTNLNASTNSFQFTIPSSNYYDSGTNIQGTGSMTFTPNGNGIFQGSIAGEKTGNIIKRPNFSVIQQNSGAATVSLTNLTNTGAKFSVGATGGTTTVNVRGLIPGGTYGIYINSQLMERMNADTQGALTFSHSYGSNDNVVIQQQAATDTIPPTIQSTLPANGTVGVELTQDVTITFSEAMNKTATQSAFSFVGGGATVAGSITWQTGNATLVFSPSQILAYNTKYFANVSTGASDIAGNKLQSQFSTSFTTKSTIDTVPPSVTDVYPASGSTGVSTRPTVIVTFSEIMNISATSNSIHLSSTDGVVNGDLSWMDFNTTAHFTPSTDLFSSKTYTITVEQSARDLAGNNMTGRFTSTFVTEANATDTTKPTIQSTVPLGGSTEVEITQNVAVFFSEQMNKTSVEAVFSMQNGSLSVGGSFSWDSQGTSCTFTPYRVLGYSSTYIVTIGATAKDVAGNMMAASYSLSFTTKSSNDVLPPTVTDVYPSDGATDVSTYVTIAITFSESMNVSATANAFHLSSTSGDIPGTMQWANKNTTLIFTPSSSLVPSTEYTVDIRTSASDLIGNHMTSEFNCTFVTGSYVVDTSAPVIEHVQSGNAEVGSPFYLTANVTDASKLASVTLAYVDVTGAYHSLAMGLVGLSFFDATIPGQTAPGTVRYTIKAQDEFGNVAISTEYALRVLDTTAPSIRIISPSNGTIVSSLINIETVATDNYGISSVEFFVDNISAMNDTVEPYVFLFNPTKVTNGSHIIDVVAYGLSGMRSSASIEVNVEINDSSPPTLTTVYPSDGMTGVNISVKIFIAFSERMDASSTLSAISLEYGGFWIGLNKTMQDGSSLTLSPIANLQYGTLYTIHINATAMDVAGNALRGGLEFTFRTQSRDGAQTVSGVVIVDRKPVSNAIVTDGFRTVLTDGYGSFIFQNVPSGSYSLSASKWNYSCGQLIQVTVNDGQSISGLRFLIVPAPGMSAISGVLLDNNNTTTLMGALVKIKETSQTGFTDANGRFVISNVTPGTYSLEISKLSYNTKTASNVIVSQGMDAAVISLNLSSTVEPASNGVTSPNAIAVGNLALPFAIGAGIAALAGGMVMRGPRRSERKKLFGHRPDDSPEPADKLAIGEIVTTKPEVSKEIFELDRLVEEISGPESKSSRVKSDLDADGKEDFERGLKELERLK